MNKYMERRRAGSIKMSNWKTCITLPVLYSVVVFIILMFLIGITIFENVDTYMTRPEQGYKTIQDINHFEILDENMPAGIKKQYTWTINDIDKDENCFAFFVVHQYVEVYIDGKLIYSLKPKNENKIGKTTASNWVMVPIYPEDSGKELHINVIPVYESVRNKPIDFLLGSKMSICFSQLKQDMPQIILSLFAIGIGIAFSVISIIYRYKGQELNNVFYLGMISCCIGTWKLMDLRSASLLFSKNPLALSYISISMLLLVVIPWMLSIKKQFLNRSYFILKATGVLSCISILIIIGLQVLNISDLRENLIFIHIIIAVVTVVTVGTVIYDGKKNKNNRKKMILYVSLLFCGIGTAIDMITYYIKGNSTGILSTLTAFLIYIVTMGYISIKQIHLKANIDMHTGVFNKSRCKEMLDKNVLVEDSTGIMMFDLNRLKYTNDTFGHETGDVLIAEFANILKNNLSNHDFIGRYGGDEFIVVLRQVNENMIQSINRKISEAVCMYNKKNHKIAISYSMGYALAEDYPGLTLRELLKEADNYMYRNKKIYHDKIAVR